MRTAFATLAFSLLAVFAGAAVFVVDTTNDVIATDGLISLREAVIWANTNAGTDEIHLPAGTYTLAIPGAGEDASLTGDLDVNDSVNIRGAGAAITVLDAGGLDRVLFLNHDVKVTLADLSVVGGIAGEGGGIYNESILHVVRCNIAANGAYNFGGGIFQFGGVMSLRDSSVFNNEAGGSGGGGIDVAGGEVGLTNCTISGNSSQAGAGIHCAGGVATLSHCTVASNTAVTLAGGLYNATRAANCIVAGNVAINAPDVGGGLTSLGCNLFGAGNPVTVLPSDVVTGNADIQDLSYSAGATPMHALRAGSPAINRADPLVVTNMLANDQRGPGYPRVRGLRADIGAYEHANPDDDQDGMPDEWEWHFGLNPTNAADAGLDPDLDTFVNAAEYVADTVPTNFASHHRVDGLSRTGDVWAVLVPSSTACLYRLRSATGLVAATWTSELSMAVGEAGSTRLQATNPPGAFLRVTVERP